MAALVAEGMSNRQIASALQVSPCTVDGHIANILADSDSAPVPRSQPGG
ncbi:LuxR C-terminal-related transcriptional regulator [Streptomyces coeruleorubidus]